MSKYQPLFERLGRAESTEDLLAQIEDALDDYEDLLEAKRASSAEDIVRQRSFNLRIHLSKFFASLVTGEYADQRHHWAREIEAITDDVVGKISSATRYANERFYTDLIYGQYTPVNRLKRQRYTATFIAATQSTAVKVKVYDYLQELSAIRDRGELDPLFDKFITLDS